jgi:2,6-dihydroxypseudooxynicotine hydrolase
VDADQAEILLTRLKDHARSRRWFGLGARSEELFDTFGRIDRLDQWCDEFRKTGERFEHAAESIDDADVRAATLLQATLYHHLGTLGLFEDSEERITAYRRVVGAYDKARLLFRIPAEKIEYTFDELPFTGYLRRAPGVDRSPCIILMRGLDANREVELHTISAMLPEKGLSTVAIDAEGQGESRFAGMTLSPDISRSVGRVIDYLESRPEIDSERIGIFGQSFAGFLAVGAAAREKRLKACVSLGSFYSLLDFERNELGRNNMMMNLRIGPAEWEAARARFTMDGVIDQLTCPFLAANGADDAVIPASQTVKLYERAPKPKSLRIYEGGPHCAYYDNKTVIFDIADWLLMNLHSDEPSG